MLKITYCLDNLLTDGSEVVSFKRRPRSTGEKHVYFCIWYPFLLQADLTRVPSAAGRIG
jgi:hypothetical protein